MIDKHFRLTEEAIRQIEGRDKIRFPTESRFIVDAVNTFVQNEARGKKEAEVEKLCEKMDSLLQWFEENTPWDEKQGSAPKPPEPYDYLDGV